MSEGLSARPGAKRVHQTLPRHMRRRAMSHNAKRLPVRLRQAAERDIVETGSHTTSEKRKRSRRHRRRPGNIAEEYASRSEACTWLETHIWHAKRMHITALWGWRIPQTPCDKSARAAYRATATDCTIWDRSYNGCIEVATAAGAGGAGDRFERLVTFLSTFMQHVDVVQAASNIEHTRAFYADLNADAAAADGGGGAAAAAAVVAAGRGEQEQFLGTVTVMWRPTENAGNNAAGGGGGDGASAAAWLWVHASAYDSILGALKQKAAGGSIVVTGLKTNLVRFELTGPTCHALLQSVLAPVGDGDAGATSEGTATGAGSGNGSAAGSAAVWKALLPLGSPASLSPSAMLGLNVLDPRLLSPSQTKPRARPAMRAARNAAYQNDSAELTQLMAEWPRDAARSAIWSAEARAALLAAQQSTKDVNIRREALLIPGDSLPVQANDARIPILLVQRPGATVGMAGSHPSGSSASGRGSGGITNGRGCAVGYGAGWDIVVPSGWAMAFWLPLVLAGARAIGMDEHRAACLEMGVLTEPHDNPDTASHAKHTAATAHDAEAFHSRRPPKNKVNYAKLGIASPFRTDWAAVVAGCVSGGGGSPRAGGRGEGGKSVGQGEGGGGGSGGGSARTSEKKGSTEDDDLPEEAGAAAEALQQSRVRVLRKRADRIALHKRLHAVLESSNEGCAGAGAGAGAGDGAGASVGGGEAETFMDSEAVACVSVELGHKKGTPKAGTLICCPSRADLALLAADHGHPGVQFSHHALRTVLGACTAGNFSFTRGFGHGLGFVAAAGVERLAALVGKYGNVAEAAEARRHAIVLPVLLRNTTSPHFRFARMVVSPNGPQWLQC